MTLDEFNQYCSELTSTTKVVQWGGAHVWKVGGKIFAIASYWGPNKKNPKLPEEGSKISFKCSNFSYSILIDQENFTPAPYLARAKWVQLEQSDALNVDDLKLYIAQAHSIVSSKLTQKRQKELGVLPS